MHTATLPVIVLTAQQGESEKKALDLGAQDYLTKPVKTRTAGGAGAGDAQAGNFVIHGKIA